jgi:hypothetical protein
MAWSAWVERSGKFNTGRCLVVGGLIFSIISMFLPKTMLDAFEKNFDAFLSPITQLTGSFPLEMGRRAELVFAGMVLLIIGLALETYAVYTDIQSYGRVTQEMDNLRLRMIILFIFLLTFFIARFYVVLFRPDIDPVYGLWIRGFRIHHFVIGVLLLMASGGIGLLSRDRWKMIGGMLYGAGLGLTIDEFGLLITSGDYWSSISYTLFVLLSLIISNAILLEAYSIKRRVVVGMARDETDISSIPSSSDER